MIRTLLFIVALVCAMSGCSMSADTAAAEQDVTRFHSLLDAGQFEQIYDQSSPVMKSASTKANLTTLLEAVHRKLGNMKSSTRTNWKVNYLTSGTFIILTYKTVYERGDASEEFVFVKDSSEPTLAGYHINSNALVVN